jgi:hypothetical protein
MKNLTIRRIGPVLDRALMATAKKQSSSVSQLARRSHDTLALAKPPTTAAAITI